MIKKIIITVLTFQTLNFFSQKAGINFSYIDSSASPQNDFLQILQWKMGKKLCSP
jgi:hypothetical protein